VEEQPLHVPGRELVEAHSAEHGHQMRRDDLAVPPEQLVDGEQRPDLLFQAGSVAGAQHVPVEQGVPQGEVGGLDLPAFVVEPDQGGGRVAAVVGQGGDQPVAVVHAAAVRAGHGQVGFDDSDRQAVQTGQVGAVG
jgi:hypothetical protein